MHTKAQLSKVILQNNADLEGAAQKKVCQTDKCSAHSDDKDCYGQTVVLDNLLQTNQLNIHLHQVAPDHQPAVTVVSSFHVGRWLLYRERAHVLWVL